MIDAYSYELFICWNSLATYCYSFLSFQTAPAVELIVPKNKLFSSSTFGSYHTECCVVFLRPRILLVANDCTNHLISLSTSNSYSCYESLHANKIASFALATPITKLSEVAITIISSYTILSWFPFYIFSIKSVFANTARLIFSSEMVGSIVRFTLKVAKFYLELN